AEDPEDGEVAPEEAGFDAKRLARVDSIIRHAIRAGAAPGAALVIGRHGKIVRMRGYGRTDWSPIAPVVTDSTLYDLASLTKAVGTATVAMQLAQEAGSRWMHPFTGTCDTGRRAAATATSRSATCSRIPPACRSART